MAKTKRIEIAQSGVVFDKEQHRYFLDGKELSGITDVIHRQLFPSEFKGIPARILNAAAEYGTDVHERIEKFDSSWINDNSAEVIDYVSICKEYRLTHEASEYLVSDNENWASSIDKLYRLSDTSFGIGEIKTYYGKLTGDKLEKCRWQLSVYAYFFELQNKKAQVDRLFVIHLRNKVKSDGKIDHIKEYIEVERIPSDICKELLDCDLRGEQFKNPFALPEEINPMLAKLRELTIEKNRIEEELNSLKSNVLESMTFLDVKTWLGQDIRITRKLPTIRTSFDLTSFKAGHPEITDYDSYMKTSNVSGSLLVTI